MRFPDQYQTPADRGAWSETETDAVDFHGSLQIPIRNINAPLACTMATSGMPPTTGAIRICQY